MRQRGIRLIHSHGKGAGLYGRVAGRLGGVPAVHTFHGIHFERYAAPARAAYLALERRLSSWTARVVNVSREQEREAEKATKGPATLEALLESGDTWDVAVGSADA